MLLLRKGLSLTDRQGEGMVRRARRSAPQWDSGMPMIPLKPRESGDVQMVFWSAMAECAFLSSDNAEFVFKYVRVSS